VEWILDAIYVWDRNNLSRDCIGKRNSVDSVLCYSFASIFWPKFSVLMTYLSVADQAIIDARVFHFALAATYACLAQSEPVS